MSFIRSLLTSIYFISLLYKLQEVLPSKLSTSQTDKQYIILQWTNKSLAPFNAMKEGNSAFVIKQCRHTNCFVTDKRDYLPQLEDFDAIAFNGREVIHLSPEQLPQNRSRKQKYIYGNLESPDRFPVCDSIFDGFFNWTWTYKLDSDIQWEYFTTYDLAGNAVGPAIDMQWPKDLIPVSNGLKNKLMSKSKAAVWFVSNCRTPSKRERFVEDLQRELEEYGWSVDVYGRCGPLDCSKSREPLCFNLIQKDYYFYLSFENSFSEDYVTEKLETALNNDAVPVVYGGADYSRFLPPGSYLDAKEFGPKKLAETMNDIINNKALYYDFFRWRSNYKYKRSAYKVGVCNLCAMMNNEEKVAEESVWYNFRSWWNGATYSQRCKSFKV